MAVLRLQPERGDPASPADGIACRRVAQHGDADPVPRLGAEVRVVQALVLRARVAEPELEEAAPLLPPPALAGPGGELRAQVAVVIKVLQAENAVFIPQKAHAGVVAGGGIVLQPQKAAEAAGDHTAVGDHGHALPRVGFGDLGQGRGKARAKGGKALCAGNGPGLGMTHEQAKLLRVGALQLAHAAILPDAHAHLPQPRIAPKGQALGPADRLGGLAGTAEVAGIDRIDGDAGETLFQSLQLAKAVGGQPGVVLPVQAAEDVPLGLGMADDIQKRHIKAPSRRFPAAFSSSPRQSGRPRGNRRPPPAARPR